tara:strand:- start:78 stop:485 length:408 start_codon:yes stop_codon:yes gene_type:complete
MFAAIPLIGTIVEKVGNYFTKKQETKTAKITGEAKLAMRKETGAQEIALTDAEWEAISAKGLTDSWKDEYVTLIITAPIVGVLVGAVWNAFTGNDKLLVGTLSGIRELGVLGLNWDTLTTAVVLAAIGLKMWRAK